MNFHKETNLASTSIGEIPKDWKEATLEDMTLSHKQGFYTNESYSEKGVRLVRITDLLNPKISYETMPFLSVDDRTYEQFKVAVGDFLFARSGAIGRHGIVTKDMPCMFASYIIRFRFDESLVSNYFLSQLFQASFIKSQFLSKMHGATNININAENIKSIKIPLPPLDEQENIVTVLGVIDSAIELADRVIAKTERLKKGLMQQLLTHGIGHTEYKNTPIGKIPTDWQVKATEDLFIVETGTTPSTKEETYWKDGTVNWLTPTDLSKLNGKLRIKSSERKITEKALKETNLALMPKGSIILSTRAPVGYVATLEEDATFNQGCKGLIPRSTYGIFTDFYSYYLSSKKEMLQNLSGGSTFLELSKSRLEKFSMPYLPLPEQNKIAEILTTVDKRLELETYERLRLENTKRGFMDLLLTGKIRVKVD